MKLVKYAAAVLCIVLAIASLPSAWLIAYGLISTQTDDPLYFTIKLFVYIAMIVVFAILSIRLFKSAGK